MKRAGWIALALCLMLTPLGTAAALPGDGLYTVEATLAGGTGRASVASPAELAVENGVAMATVVWSSPYYEYMVVGEETYYPVQGEGNSTFVIPVALDADMAISAQTVAMSQPHVIQYTLRFDAKTLRPLGGGGALAGGIPPWGLAALVPAIVVALACAVFFLLRCKNSAPKGRTP